MHRQLGLELGDPAPRSGKLGLLPTGQTWRKTLIDPVLTTPRVDRLGADLQIPSNLGHWPTGLDQIKHLATKLRRIPTTAHAASSKGQWTSESRNLTPRKPGHTTGVHAVVQELGAQLDDQVDDLRCGRLR